MMCAGPAQFAQVRVGGAFSEALVRTPASANDLHGKEAAALNKWLLELVHVLKTPHSSALTRSCVEVPFTIALYRLGILPMYSPKMVHAPMHDIAPEHRMNSEAASSKR
jgi:hypothetical protein